MRGKPTLPLCSVISFNLKPQHRFFTILPLQNVSVWEVCEFILLLPQMVACSQIVFHVHLNYREGKSQVGKKGRGKKELAYIISINSTTVLYSWQLEILAALLHEEINSLFHILPCKKCYEICMPSAQSTPMNRWETQYGTPNATFWDRPKYLNKKNNNRRQKKEH